MSIDATRGSYKRTRDDSLMQPNFPKRLAALSENLNDLRSGNELIQQCQYGEAIALLKGKVSHPLTDLRVKPLFYHNLALAFSNIEGAANLDQCIQWYQRSLEEVPGDLSEPMTIAARWEQFAYARFQRNNPEEGDRAWSIAILEDLPNFVRKSAGSFKIKKMLLERVLSNNLQMQRQIIAEWGLTRWSHNPEENSTHTPRRAPTPTGSPESNEAQPPSVARVTPETSDSANDWIAGVFLSSTEVIQI